MYRHETGAGADQNHHYLSANSATSTFSQTQFPSPLFNIDPRVHNSPQHLRPTPQNAISSESTQPRRSSNESSNSMQPPSNISPRMNRATPVQSNSHASDRALPSRDVTPDTITDAFVSFILYCNPNFPLDVDASTLRTGFETPPKSDNKDFETFRLYELIKQFDAKEIKTWSQLALSLGVEAPDVSKGQSVQKVQQYSVRLKRWMRATHIDAFFEYLLGKQHVYFTDLPPANDPYPATGRDGVLAEEDLAIRALDPSFRPKRGRRRNSETEQDDGDGSSKHPRSAYPSSAMPMSAHPDGFNDPWASAVSAINPRGSAPWGGRDDVPQSAIAPPQHRWHVHGGENVMTPHPMTAHPGSMASHIESAFDNEPKSAITSSARKRRKHGPAVSSAWTSTNTPGSKPRGRPPANRNVQDGPYSTFPVDPSNDRAGSNAGRPSSPEAHLPSEDQSALQMAPPLLRRQSDGPGRGGRLSLQVPQHTGGPVRLATPPPPPRLLVTDDNNPETTAPTQPINPSRIRTVGNLQILERAIPGFMFETLKRILTSDLLRADLTGRPHRLTSTEAKALAETVLSRLGVPRQDTDSSRDDIARLTAASWLGLGEQLNVPLGPATSRGKKIAVTRFRADAEGYEEIVSAYEAIGDAGETRDVFDLSWTVSLAGCNGSFELKGLGLSEPPADIAGGEDDESEHDQFLRRTLAAAQQIGNGDREDWVSRTMRDVGEGSNAREEGDEDGIDWKAKYKAIEFGTKVAMGELERSKSRMIQKVLDALL